MTTEHRHDRFIKQLDGSRYAGLNCTCASGAMGGHRHSNGAVRVSGARVRQLTGDTSGGTNLLQVQAAMRRLGVGLAVYQGFAITTLYRLLRAKRGALVQGASSATRGTKWQASPTFGGNHCWYVSVGARWRVINGYWRPDLLRVYDPLADGRRSGIAKSPFWLPRAYFERFTSRLWLGARQLGAGRAYFAVTRVTWPHIHSRYGGVPYRKSLKTKGGYAVRTAPSRTTGRKTAVTKAGVSWGAWQRTTRGQSLGGSTVWYGNHEGTRWIHSSALA